MSLINDPQELEKFINERLKPKTLEKQQFGEVFTPFKLINEMLDKLPVEVWSNKSLKWLDPCCGIGNFSIVVYQRLMEGLKDVIECKDDRKKHILEKMLYMCELNIDSVAIVKVIFNKDGAYNLNLYCGDSLKSNWYKCLGFNKFDVIVGNPPYNGPRPDSGKTNGNSIWALFVRSAIESLNERGYLCFVHPSGWRKPNTSNSRYYGLFSLMTVDNSMLYLEMHSIKDGRKMFSCDTCYDFYVLQKCKLDNHLTKIVDKESVFHSIDLSAYKWLPNCELELVSKLIAGVGDEKLKVIRLECNRAEAKHMSAIETEEFKHKVVHTIPKTGARILYSNKKDDIYKDVKYKVIIGDSGKIFHTVIDLDNTYSTSGNSVSIVVDNEAEAILVSKALKSFTFNKRVFKGCLWSSYGIEWRMFLDFKKSFYSVILKEDENT